MRFGLVGTGPWATGVHGPGLRAARDATLDGVWGRDGERTRALADALGVRPYDDLDDLLADVDAVAFAVPPSVQAELALRAARAGKHLLLDKPVATDVAAARALAEVVTEQGVASVVFFTDRFSEVGSAWIEEARRTGGWRGGEMRWLAALAEPGGQGYPKSPWRFDRGALWDIGPHALSTMIALLGPVDRIVAVAGQEDLVHLVLTHRSGATSTATLGIFTPAAAETQEVWLWGDHGLTTMPGQTGADAPAALGRAADALVRSATTGEPHPADLRLGVRVVELLAEAERQKGARAE
ncbi:Gfo/Idh/MocA family protein [Nocardioides caldifontis]|uniref:Gfo/Idh/MocA family protein n=1 Tax=Nocardioides caldifontis TaxID=2588938 RepID=UPI0011E0631A|nr:Gfo/Idh/MocA family oxidoreductase [Nocardioides caldifontis]